jgi:DNA (cytosine-5)-methyltransferase 1
MKAIDLFAGCGGLSLGFENAGINVLAAFDNWDPTILVYEKNFRHPIFKKDLSNTEELSVFQELKPDVIAGGPPCQDFSSAGKRNEDLGRADLTLCFAKIVGKLQPKWFIMENVERILKSKTLPKALDIFKRAKYGLSSMVLNASFCGVPQDRKRFFLIGELDGPDGALEYYLKKNQSKKPMTVKDYFGNQLDVDHYYRHPRSYQRRAIFSVNEPSPTIRGVNRPVAKGYKKHPGDPVKITKDLRPLTTAERSQIQTFPKDFVFVGNKTTVEQMIGNAVPVKLAQYVASCLLEYVADKENNNVQNDKLFAV